MNYYLIGLWLRCDYKVINLEMIEKMLFVELVIQTDNLSSSLSLLLHCINSSACFDSYRWVDIGFRDDYLFFSSCTPADEGKLLKYLKKWINTQRGQADACMHVRIHVFTYLFILVSIYPFSMYPCIQVCSSVLMHTVTGLSVFIHVNLYWSIHVYAQWFIHVSI